MPELTAERARELFNYDPLTGVLTRRVTAGSAHVGSHVGGKNVAGYLVASVGNRQYRVHRVIWLLVHGQWPTYQVDHINGDRTDNRIDNLRDVPCATNLQNRRSQSAGSRYSLLGVSWDARGNKFRTSIRSNGNRLFLGLFNTPEEAHQAYLTAKRRLHAGNTL